MTGKLEISGRAATQAGSWLRHLPVGLFAMVMGLSGLSLAAWTMARLGVLPQAVAMAALVAAALVFLGVGGLYLLKLLRHRDAVRAEWSNPVRIAFFPAISVGLLLIATAMHKLGVVLAEPVWIAGTAAHLVLVIGVFSAWIGHRPFQTVHLNPVWFIPAVGNGVVPLAGFPMGYVEISWLFLAIGLTFWLVLLTLVFNRLVFHDPLPEKLAPTLVIMIAPPAVCFLAWTTMSGGVLDAFGRILYYLAVLLTLLVLPQLPRLARLRFSLSWWAYSFPVAALSVSSMSYGQMAGVMPLIWLGEAVFALLVALIALLLWRTLRAAMQGEICVPE